MKSFEGYCDNIEDVENYEQAKADNFKGWVCHHRLELIATGGVCDVDRQDLIDWGIYCHRPADELIFLTRKEHNSLHHKGKHLSEELKRKHSEAMKGKHWKLSEEARINHSEAMKGKNTWTKGRHHSEETKKKMSESAKGNTPSIKGMHWKLVDGKRVYY